MPFEHGPEYEAKTCKGKRRHTTRDHARQIARMMRKSTGDTQLRAYRCNFCRGYHIGHLGEHSRFKDRVMEPDVVVDTESGKPGTRWTRGGGK